MPHATTDDGVRLYYEETGSGSPVVFVHEFAGDHRSWEPQMRALGQRHRCITYAARGYPPSEVPETVTSYSQARAREDIKAMLDHLGIEKAHVVGLSMGGFATLHFGLAHPERAVSLTIAGCGYGAEREKRTQFRAETEAVAAAITREGMAKFADTYAVGPARVQFANKDPRGFEEFRTMLAEHSSLGSANTQLGVQRERPSLYDLENQLRTLTIPTLIVSGDEDTPCLQPALYLKRVIPTAGLLIVPNTGHTINLEQPDAFNRAIADFIAEVECGRWPTRDPRAVSDSIMGVKT